MNSKPNQETPTEVSVNFRKFLGSEDGNFDFFSLIYNFASLLDLFRGCGLFADSTNGTMIIVTLLAYINAELTDNRTILNFSFSIIQSLLLLLLRVVLGKF